MRLYTILNKLSTLVNQHTQQISSLNNKPAVALTAAEMTVINRNDDLNNYTTPGSYLSQGASVSGTLSNTPYTVGIFTLIVSQITSTALFQLIITANTAEKVMYIRSSTTNGASWSNWRLLSSVAV